MGGETHPGDLVFSQHLVFSRAAPQMEGVDYQDDIRPLLDDLPGIYFRGAPPVEADRFHPALQSLDQGRPEAVITPEGIADAEQDHLSGEDPGRE